MPRSSPILTAFNAGEWSPQLYGRTDLAKYGSAARQLRNMLVGPHGLATRRTGGRHVAAAKTPTTRGPRLVPFKFSTIQAYVLEHGGGYVRFFMDRGRIESPPGTPVEIATPYLEADLAKLKWAQSADKLYLVAEGYWPQESTRTGHTSWTIADFVPKDGPYLDQNITATTITPSAATGSITLTASASIFQAGHVGSYWRIEEPAGHLNYPEWTAATSYTTGDKVRSDNKVYQAANTTSSKTVQPLHTSGTQNDGGVAGGGVNWAYLHNGHGYAKITGFTSGTVVDADVIATLPGTTATAKWREGAWSAVRGYPTAIVFHEERLGFAGTVAQPQTVWLSASNAYDQFGPTADGNVVLDDTAITFTISDNEMNAIRWMLSQKVLIIGTVGGVHTAQASDLNEAITPTNLTVRAQATVGAADTMPLRLNDAVMFIERARRKLYTVRYRFETDSYGAPETTLLAQHLGRLGLVEIAQQPQPFGIVWAVAGNGELLGLTYLPDHDVLGWHRHPLGGADARAVSVAVVPAETQDRLWLSVARTVDGATSYSIEYLEDEFWPDEFAAKDYGFFVDAGLTYDGWNADPAKTLTLAGGPPWTIGAPKSLMAGGHAPFSPASVDRIYRFRKPGTVWPAVAVQVTSFASSAEVGVELLTDIPAPLRNVAVDWWGLAASTISGLDHLEGETVQVLADGAAHPDRTVEAGAIALQSPAAAVSAGLGYSTRLETMNLEGGSAEGSQQGKAQRISKATLRLFGSLGCRIGYDDDHLETVQFRDPTMPMDASPPLFSGDKRVDFPKGWDREARVLVVQEQPLPLTVLGIVPRSQVNDG